MPTVWLWRHEDDTSLVRQLCEDVVQRKRELRSFLWAHPAACSAGFEKVAELCEARSIGVLDRVRRVVGTADAGEGEGKNYSPTAPCSSCACRRACDRPSRTPSEA